MSNSEANDIRVLCSLPDHPKTKKLIRRLGPGAGWYLIRLWLWARDNRPSGDLAGMTGEDIELAIDWSGDNDAFVATLVDVRLLDGEEGAYRLHDWADHNPWSTGSAMRSSKARWNAVKRHHGQAEADRQVPEYARIRAASTENDAASTKSDAASNVAAMHAASPSNAAIAKTDAPSPSPSPSPSPKEVEPPLPPTGGKRAKREKITFATFVAGCRERGEKPVPPADPIFGYADDTGIPREFLELAWREFARKHRDSQRQQKDWRAHFRDAVRRNWFRLWWMPPEGGCALTTQGVQAKRERDAELARKAEQQQAQAA